MHFKVKNLGGICALFSKPSKYTVISITHNLSVLDNSTSLKLKCIL